MKAFRQWLESGNRASWFIFLLFTFIVFTLSLIFDHYAFREWHIQTTALERLSMILSKLAAALLGGSIVFFLRDKRWMIFFAAFSSAWMIANLIYMRNNYRLIDAEAFNMSGNLKGYSLSVLIYFEPAIDMIFVGGFVLFCLAFLFTNRSPRNWKLGLLILALSIGLRLGAEGIYIADRHQQGEQAQFRLMPFIREQREPVYGIHFTMTEAHTSILYTPLYVLPDIYLMISGSQPVRPLTGQDYQYMQCLDHGVDTAALDGPFIIVLLESLENWVLTPQIMPNLYRLAHSDHAFYADKIHTQIVGAPSADGQMIINTGLLPINAGGTCLHYYGNTYPGIMKFATDTTYCLLPHSAKVWNQEAMSPAYGYDTTFSFCDIDTLLFEELNRLIDSGAQFVQCLTQSTHSPFLNEKYSSLEVPEDMPWVMHNYIRGFNALDEGLGHFIRKIETDSVLQKYTIVFTGDHRILHYEMRNKMQLYADTYAKSGRAEKAWIGDLKPADSCLPLVIYSPKISGNPQYTNDAYQFDIYPTCLSLLGAGSYRWQGFGINLLAQPDGCSASGQTQRPITEDEAYKLSDRLIRNDYFLNR